MGYFGGRIRLINFVLKILAEAFGLNIFVILTNRSVFLKLRFRIYVFCLDFGDLAFVLIGCKCRSNRVVLINITRI